MKNLILIIGNSKYQFNDINEIYDSLLGKKNHDYSLLSAKSKANRRRELAYINTNCNEKMIGFLQSTPTEEICKSKKIFIDSDEIYLLSLLKADLITLLVQKDYNKLTSDIDKSNLNNNYIILNNFANELLLKRKHALLQQNMPEFKDLDSTEIVESKKPDFDLDKY